MVAFSWRLPMIDCRVHALKQPWRHDEGPHTSVKTGQAMCSR